MIVKIYFDHRKRNAKMQQELKEAANDMRSVSVRDSVGPIVASPSAMPRKASIRFVSDLSL